MSPTFRRKKNSKRGSHNENGRANAGEKPGAPNWTLFALFVGMLLFGLLMVFDASYYLKEWDRITKQLIWIGIGFIGFIPLLLIDYKKLKFFAIPLAIISILLLIYTAVAGVSINGATNWIILPGGFQFQPGEIAKFAVVLALAAMLTFFREKLRIKTREDLFGATMIEFIVFFVGIGFVGLLLVLGADLGNAMILGLVALAVFFISGTEFIHTFGSILIIVIFGLLGGVAGVIAPYRFRRIKVFLDLLLNGVINDPRGDGWQISQILIGIGGSGGLDGTGFGRSRQRLGYLPEDTAFTDSIGAVVLEELGFYKSVIFVAIYCFMLYLCFQVALKAQDRFGQLLAAGMSLWLAVQFCLHMGSNLALLPLTGVTLPFISYGGTSIVMSMAAMAIILNISRYNHLDEVTKRGKKV